MFLPFASSGLRARERTCVGLNCVVFVCALVFNLVVFNIPFTSFTCNVDCLAILGSKEIIAQNHFVFMHLLRWCYLSLNWKFAFADDVTPLSRQGGGGGTLYVSWRVTEKGFQGRLSECGETLQLCKLACLLSGSSFSNSISPFVLVFLLHL